LPRLGVLGVSPLIRPALRDDLAAVRAVLVETWHATYDALYGHDKVAEITSLWHAPDRLARGLARDGHAFLVAEVDGGEIEATAAASCDAAGLVTLHRLYVRPSRQGRGLGKALLDASIAQFPGAKLVRLEVEPENEGARAFYARCGFSETGQRVRTEAGEALVYERTLAPGATSTALTVRPVRDQDAQELFGLLTLCFADYPGCYVDPHDDLADLLCPASAVAAKGGRFWVVDDPMGRIGACVTVDFPAVDTAELHRVYVRHDLRRRGLAERLVRLAEAEARERGARRMFFWSDTRFAPAHRFYQKLGYRRVGEERELGDISASREYRFEKEL
jgi:GNAT superfamily N-acetyltransferase